MCRRPKSRSLGMILMCIVLDLYDLFDLFSTKLLMNVQRSMDPLEPSQSGVER